MLWLEPQLILKIPGYNLVRIFNSSALRPISLTFVITHRCNSKCKTCNIWKIENHENELEMWEYEKISKSIGRIYWITLGGGEVFLRKDFLDIVDVLYKHLQPKFINIPSNGYFYRIIPKKIESLLKMCSKSIITLNLSLDNVGKKHDEIRGLRNNFKYLMETLHRLRRIKNERFIVGLHTVISDYNINDLERIYEYAKPLCDSYIVEIIQKRMEFFNQKMKIKTSRKKFISVLNFYLRMKGNKNKKTILIESFRKEYYKLVRRYLKNRKTAINCYAGIVSCQIDPYGNVFACPVKNNLMGNLREVNYNFEKIWKSRKAKNIRNLIKESKCVCQAANSNFTNLVVNFPFNIKILSSYLRRSFF